MFCLVKIGGTALIERSRNDKRRYNADGEMDSNFELDRSMCNKSDLADVIENLPSIQPKPKTGHWIRHKENCCYNKCSICEYEYCRESNYCPNCGARMSEVSE